MSSPWSAQDPYWFWGQKVKVKNSSLNFASFHHSYSTIFWLRTIMNVIFTTWRGPLLVLGRKVPVKLNVRTLHDFWILISIYWHETMILGSKGQRSKLGFEFVATGVIFIWNISCWFIQLSCGTGVTFFPYLVDENCTCVVVNDSNLPKDVCCHPEKGQSLFNQIKKKLTEMEVENK